MVEAPNAGESEWTKVGLAAGSFYIVLLPASRAGCKSRYSRDYCEAAEEKEAERDTSRKEYITSAATRSPRLAAPNVLV